MSVVEHSSASSKESDKCDIVVLKAGYAIKQGNFFKTWKKRWCILRTMFPSEIMDSAVPGVSHAIVYYKNREDAEEGKTPCGSVLIAKGMTFVSRIQKGLKAERGTTTRECLEIRTPEYPRVYYFQPCAEVEAWMKILTDLDPPQNFSELRRMTLPSGVGKILRSSEDPDDTMEPL
eukprot:m.239166 g.239166  ORF g.239166 m.239166 type:complete len:176 (-) comp19404_c0_seq19:1586-2113(-)